MNGTTQALTDSYKGYLSEEAKRKYSLRVGLVGVGFFFVIFGFPLIIYGVMFFFMNSMQSDAFTEVIEESKIYWQGKIWYIEEKALITAEDEIPVFKLMSVPVEYQAEPVLEQKLEHKYNRLIADGDKLWLISSDQTALYRNNSISILPINEILGTISQPFLYNGNPAVIEGRLSAYALSVLENNSWKVERLLPLDKGLINFSVLYLDIASNERDTYLLYAEDETVYYHHLEPGVEIIEGDFWTPLTTQAAEWTAVILNNELTVFYPKATTLYGIKPLTNEEQLSFTFSFDPSNSTIFPMNWQNDFIMVSNKLQHIIQVKDGKIATAVERGSKFPSEFFIIFFMLAIYLSMILLPVIAVYIITKMMNKYRVRYYEFNSMQIPYATPWRRAIASVVDSMVILIPFIILVPILFLTGSTGINEYSKPHPGLFMAMIFSIFIGIILVSLLLFSYMEGKWGQTPGKWLLRIKVTNMELKPCGFGRALLRNVLRFADGMFYCMVGLLLVAFTEHWQRVGDLAARTLVLNKGSCL